MTVLRTALRSNSAFSALRKSHRLPFLLRVSPRWFSTEAQQPPQDSTADPFLGTSSTCNSIILLRGLPRDVTMQDVERFLSGYEYYQTSLNFFNRAADPDVRVATVRFPSKIEAMNAFIKRMERFVLTTQFRYGFFFSVSSCPLVLV